MKTKNEFIDYYKKSLCQIMKKEYDFYYRKYLQKRINIIIEQGILFFIAIIFVILYLKEVIVIEYFILSLAILSTFFIGMLIINIRLLKQERELYIFLINKSIYCNILSYISNDNYLYEENTQLAYEDFMKMDLFNLNLLKYTGKNLTGSNFDGKPFIFCDVALYDLKSRIKEDHYYDREEDIEYINCYHYHERVDIFKGLYFESKIKRKNKQYIYLIPNNISDLFIRKNITHYLKYDGKRVELENLDFEKKYNVYSIDEIKTRYILSITLMEKINFLDKKIPNKKYIVFKDDGRLGLFIDGFTIDSLLSKKFNFKNEPTFNYLLSFFNNINNFFYICSIFDED